MLELRSITKTFPGVRALDGVSLSFRPGEIHALMGENGAGKSTLMRVMTGIQRPDAGELYLNGQRVQLASYRDAIKLGIGMVHQEIQLIPEATIAENVLLERLPTKGWPGRIDWQQVHETAQRFTAQVGLGLPTTAVVKHLSAAQKQLIQIARALSANARVLLLDEPTSSLTEHEAENLAGILRRLKAGGVAIVYVSHKLEEVMALSDSISVLRDGRHVGTKAAAGLTAGEVVKMMIGRASTTERFGTLTPQRDQEALRVEHLSRRGRIRDCSFVLHPGEILGFYGLVGSGRSETARLIIGDEAPERGEVFVRGQRADISSVHDSLHRYRIGYVSENRKEEGLLLDATVGTNITLTVWERLRHRFTRRIDPRREEAVGQSMIQALAIKCTGLDQTTGQLSGGNQQKICMAKWLAAECDILIIDEPTVGVDVGAKQHIHQLIWDLAARDGRAVILISSDMPEIIRLAHRILVFNERRIVGEVTGVDDPQHTYEVISQRIGAFLA